MNINTGEYRIEYYDQDNRLVASEPAISYGAALTQASTHCTRKDVLAASWAIVRCVMTSAEQVW